MLDQDSYPVVAAQKQFRPIWQGIPMQSVFSNPLDETLFKAWRSITRASWLAFLFIVGVSVLAFGFEMTNLTLHHDDLGQMFIQDTILGYYLGRFGAGWLHFYTQNAYFMPFFQMAEGIVVMAVYGLLIARFWGLRKTLDIALAGAIVCVFPFMALVYQYNTSMATYSVAHLLAAGAIIASTRATVRHTAAAALLYIGAFSIYQSVLANAATLFGFWALSRLLFEQDRAGFFSRSMARSALTAALAVIVGGVVYVAIVWQMHIPFDAEQAAGDAFGLKRNVGLSEAIRQVVSGTRAFYLWPENYFPDYLKKLQLLLIVGAAATCLWIPRGLKAKVTAVAIFGLTLFAPRLVQLLHPAGHYHNLTLTAYALVVAGCLTLLVRGANNLVRNGTALAAVVLIWGYVLQCNWVSTVNVLNTQAHFAAVTQILARIRSQPEAHWDGKTIVVAGSYKMWSGYPFKPTVGVATQYLNMDTHHMEDLAHLLRDDVTFLTPDQATPAVRGFVAAQPSWPDPTSVGVVDGMGVVVLSKDTDHPAPH